MMSEDSLDKTLRHMKENLSGESIHHNARMFSKLRPAWALTNDVSKSIKLAKIRRNVICRKAI